MYRTLKVKDRITGEISLIHEKFYTEKTHLILEDEKPTECEDCKIQPLEATDEVLEEETTQESSELTKEELQAILDEKGIDYDKRSGVKKLKELINN